MKDQLSTKPNWHFRLLRNEFEKEGAFESEDKVEVDLEIKKNWLK